MINLLIEDENDGKSFYFEDFFGDQEALLNQFELSDRSLKATLNTHDLNLNCYELIRIKTLLFNLNIKINCIYSKNRETVISAKSIKINTIYYSNICHNLNFKNIKNKNHVDTTHFGMVRSGDKISSNGNLIIVGDVNPGAYISAKKNIYIWGKLCGVAFAGKNGRNNSTIASLFLNPLQLRINKTIAIGPKEKPNNNYPEIACIENGKIIIRPLIINK